MVPFERKGKVHGPGAPGCGHVRHSDRVLPHHFAPREPFALYRRRFPDSRPPGLRLGTETSPNQGSRVLLLSARFGEIKIPW